MTFYDGNKPGGTPGLLPGPYYCKEKLLELSKEMSNILEQGGKAVHSWEHL